ncbi:uncharacterized protein J3R85_018417 [Psidium guajava]|nr:uncharacterized protein J3R85_018417 [Psidium guajava]
MRLLRSLLFCQISKGAKPTQGRPPPKCQKGVGPSHVHQPFANCMHGRAFPGSSTRLVAIDVMFPIQRDPSTFSRGLCEGIHIFCPRFPTEFWY